MYSAQMVRRGEYLERAVVIAAAPHALEGLFHRGERAPSVVIAAPHPERGGSMEGPIIAELAWALTRQGHATLRFNYPGIGASAGQFDEALAAEALGPVAEHLQDCTPQRNLIGLGVGFGGRLLLQRAAALSLAQVIWVAPDPEDAPVGPGAYTGALQIVVAQGENTETKAKLRAWADSIPNAQYVVVPGADTRYLRGLVTLGRVACELVQTAAGIHL